MHLRYQILGQGYDYYNENLAELVRFFPLQWSDATVSESPPMKASEKEELQLPNLPTEILIRIVKFTYQLTLDELPSSHPLIVVFGRRVPRREHSTSSSPFSSFKHHSYKSLAAIQQDRNGAQKVAFGKSRKLGPIVPNLFRFQTILRNRETYPIPTGSPSEYLEYPRARRLLRSSGQYNSFSRAYQRDLS